MKTITTLSLILSCSPWVNALQTYVSPEYDPLAYDTIRKTGEIELELKSPSYDSALTNAESNTDSPEVLFYRHHWQNNLHRLAQGLPLLHLHEREKTKIIDGKMIRYRSTYRQHIDERNALIQACKDLAPELQATRRKATYATTASCAFLIGLILFMRDNGALLNINFSTFLTQWNVIFLLPVFYLMGTLPTQTVRHVAHALNLSRKLHDREEELASAYDREQKHKKDDDYYWQPISVESSPCLSSHP